MEGFPPSTHLVFKVLLYKSGRNLTRLLRLGLKFIL